MRIQLNRIILIAMTMAIWPDGTSQAQQLHDSLLKYLEISASANPAVNKKFYEYRAALQKIPQAAGIPDPEVSAGIFMKPMELLGGKQLADLRLMQMFPWFGVLRSAKDEMSFMAKASYESFRDTKLQLFYDVQLTWYELYKIRKNISVSDKNMEILNTIEKLSLIRFRSASVTVAGSRGANTASIQENEVGSSLSASSGMPSMESGQTNILQVNQMQSPGGMEQSSMGSEPGSPGLADLYQIRIESAGLQNMIEGLKDQSRTLTAKFNGYLNRPPDTPVFTPQNLSPDTTDLTIISAPDSILKNNPMLTMIDYETRSVDARKKMIKGMGYPMVGLGLNYSIIGRSGMSAGEMNGKDMVMPMVSVTLPVYRKKYNAMAAEADLLKTASINEYASTAQNLQTEYYAAFQKYQDAKRRVLLYNYQSQLASKSLEITIKSFASAATPLTDLLRIRQQTFDYELRESEAVADLNAAVASLKRLIAFSEIKE